MTDTSKVALLVDFENLVFGLEAMHGEDYAEHVEPEVLIRLAEEYGQVVLANAYADWRSRDVNQFQTDLYRLGIDLVHVFAKRQQTRFKNAVDVKMAVDAVETVWTLPHISTFVIVSGDRDFIHVLKALRRYGKTVVGISPDQSVSEDFASLCDRFVRYGALLSSYRSKGASPDGESREHSLDSVRTALREILTEHPEGVKGAQIKPLLRRHLSATFDESEYGFGKLSDLVASLPDVATIIPRSAGNDIVVYPAGATPADEPHDATPSPVSKESDATVDPVQTLIRAAGLSTYRFDSDRDRRHRILSMLFSTMRSEEPFALADVFERTIEENDGLGLTTSRLAKYQSILWHARCFILEPGEQDAPVRHRLMRLRPDIASVSDIIAQYETNIAYKLGAAATAADEPLTVATLRVALGLSDTPDDTAYCSMLLEKSG